MQFNRITGKYRGLEKGLLIKMREGLMDIIGQMGCPEYGAVRSIAGSNIPLWVEVEFLANIVRYEIEHGAERDNLVN